MDWKWHRRTCRRKCCDWPESAVFIFLPRTILQQSYQKQRAVVRCSATNCSSRLQCILADNRTFLDISDWERLFKLSQKKYTRKNGRLIRSLSYHLCLKPKYCLESSSKVNKRRQTNGKLYTAPSCRNGKLKMRLLMRLSNIMSVTHTTKVTSAKQLLFHAASPTSFFLAGYEARVVYRPAVNIEDSEDFVQQLPFYYPKVRKQELVLRQQQT